jgi:hypothetical protein
MHEQREFTHYSIYPGTTIHTTNRKYIKNGDRSSSVPAMDTRRILGSTNNSNVEEEFMRKIPISGKSSKILTANSDQCVRPKTLQYIEIFSKNACIYKTWKVKYPEHLSTLYYKNETHAIIPFIIFFRYPVTIVDAAYLSLNRHNNPFDHTHSPYATTQTLVSPICHRLQQRFLSLNITVKRTMPLSRNPL